MKIALVGARSFPAAHGGLEVVVEALAYELAKSNAVTVYAGDGSADPSNSIDVVRSPALRGKYTHTASQMLSGLARLRGARHDVVHIHGVGPAFILLLWSRRSRRAKVFVTAHGLDWEREKWPTFARLAFRKISVMALRRADFVSAVSRQTASSLEPLLGRSVEFISNGVSLPESGEAVPDLPAKYAVVMSRLTPEKNVESIVRAWTPAIADTWGPLVVIGGGKGSYASEYEESLRQIQNDRVIWAGSLPRADALATLRSAALFISMSRTEAQPMAVIEALTLGVRVVLSDIPEHRQVADDAGDYVSLLTESLLEQRLMELGEIDPSAREERRQFWLSQSWQRIAAEYESWYVSPRLDGAIDKGESLQ